jgi:alpha-amylase
MKKTRRVFVLIPLALILCLSLYLAACNPGTDVAPVSIGLDKNSFSVKVGENGTLTATVSGTDDAVAWASSDTSVATVTGSGAQSKSAAVSALKEGTTTITATVGGQKASCVVTVTKEVNPPVDEVTISLDAATLSAEEGASKTLTATVNFSGVYI